jgi:ankyrin repeat protein
MGVQAAKSLSEQLRKRDAFGRLPIYRAAEVGNYEVVKHIAEASQLTLAETLDLAIVSSENPDHKDTWHFILLLIRRGMLHEHTDLQLKTHPLLLLAVERNDTMAIQLLYEAGGDLNSRDHTKLWYTDTALHLAIGRKNIESADVLINLGASVAILNRCGLSPLHAACSYGVLEVVSILLLHRADPNQQVPPGPLHHHEGHVPFHFAIPASMSTEIDGTRSKIAKSLLDHGADINIEDNSGRSPARLILESFYHRQRSSSSINAGEFDQLVEIFRQHRPPLFQPITKEGFMPLHLAAALGDLDLIKETLDSGVPVDWPTFGYPGMTPLVVAVENRRVEAVRLLLEYGAELSYSKWLTRRSDEKVMIVTVSQ